MLPSDRWLTRRRPLGYDSPELKDKGERGRRADPFDLPPSALELPPIPDACEMTRSEIEAAHRQLDAFEARYLGDPPAPVLRSRWFTVPVCVILMAFAVVVYVVAVAGGK